MRLLLRFFVHLLLYAIALVAVSQMFTSFYIKDFGTALLASFILAILHFLLKPILILLTLPITIITFGFFILIINAFILMLTSYLIGDAFVIEGFWVAFFAAMFVSIIHFFLQKLFGEVFKQD